MRIESIHHKPDSMRTHGSGFAPLPIRFNRVRTIVLQCELDPRRIVRVHCGPAF